MHALDPMTPPLAANERNALPWLWLAALLIGLDQWTKYLALTHLRIGEEIPVIPGLWSWSLAYNPGASFSLFADAGPWARVLFIVLAFAISGLMAYLLRRTARGDWRNALPFALVIAGALGNVIDRFRFGQVVDFVLWQFQGHKWPVFNLADSCIVVGAVLLVLFSTRRRA
jgi:signal peptidase II